MKAPQSSTYKKVVVRKLDRQVVKGFVMPSSYLGPDGVEMMDLDGRHMVVPLEQVKGVYFVREFGDSESLSRKTFTTRPRTEGLWARLRFRDNEMMEGLMPNDLTQVTGDGFLVNPPDTRSNTQRIFVPRSALASLTVLGVIGGQGRRRKPAAAADTRQVPMFTE